MNEILNLGLITAIIRVSTPLVFAALGGLLTFKAGILNIAMDGFMLVAAFLGILTAYFTGNLAWAVFAAVLGSVIMAILFGYFNLKFKADIFIAGIAVGMLASGLTAVLLQGALGQTGVFASSKIPRFSQIQIPFIDGIPILSQLFSGYSILVYLAFLFTPVVSLAMSRTKWGLRVRAVGENPDSAASVGIDVFKIKMETVILSGFFCGLGGAYLSLDYVSLFSRDMTADRGLIALAAIFFAQGNPVTTIAVTVLFGIAQALAVRLQQSVGIAPQIVQVIPYFVTMIALIAVGFQTVHHRKYQQVIE
ncbi:MAG: ABC transporter permease [Firmicutes bacterium]|nr:ABC transporter permease [Bacillota bacterium]